MFIKRKISDAPIFAYVESASEVLSNELCDVWWHLGVDHPVRYHGSTWREGGLDGSPVDIDSPDGQYYVSRGL